MLNFYVFFISLIITKGLMPLYIKLLNNEKNKKRNYNGHYIISSGGIIFFFNLSFIIALQLIYMKTHLTKEIAILSLYGLATITFIGFIDDIWGKNDSKGLSGHISNFVGGNLTTGFLKAVFGFLISAVISFYISNSKVDYLTNILLISLMMNFFNLMDLRPGRACKVFLFFSIFFVFIFYSTEYSFLIFTTLGILLAYIPMDLSEKVMLGDAGSNLLGFIAGLSLALAVETFKKIPIIFALVLIHILAERLSISTLIEKNAFLRFLDLLGRNGKEEKN
ncbi:MAG: UDP-GlcNAc:undecaprenyl-phosphate/decaprenyl-phosphate GlcNAc-phosphate transferase [Thermosediminibacterales bacterium]|nr:UDP-GlcNAc:undecaprenyl-phosphate/decaprenyl-phosphate GlcNAc-phosphate transferase [Thermosediminibacterales bacterium]